MELGEGTTFKKLHHNRQPLKQLKGLLYKLAIAAVLLIPPTLYFVASYSSTFDSPSENLTTWGQSSLELLAFKNDEESKSMMINDATSKLKESLEINPTQGGALYYMGKAQTCYAHLTLDKDEAKAYFDSALDFFQQALDQDPENEGYRKTIEDAKKITMTQLPAASCMVCCESNPHVTSVIYHRCFQ